MELLGGRTLDFTCHKGSLTVWAEPAPGLTATGTERTTAMVTLASLQDDPSKDPGAAQAPRILCTRRARELLQDILDDLRPCPEGVLVAEGWHQLLGRLQALSGTDAHTAKTLWVSTVSTNEVSAPYAVVARAGSSASTAWSIRLEPVIDPALSARCSCFACLLFGIPPGVFAWTDQDQFMTASARRRYWKPNPRRNLRR